MERSCTNFQETEEAHTLMVHAYQKILVNYCTLYLSQTKKKKFVKCIYRSVARPKAASEVHSGEYIRDSLSKFQQDASA